MLPTVEWKTDQLVLDTLQKCRAYVEYPEETVRDTSVQSPAVWEETEAGLTVVQRIGLPQGLSSAGAYNSHVQV